MIVNVANPIINHPQMVAGSFMALDGIGFPLAMFSGEEIVGLSASLGEGILVQLRFRLPGPANEWRGFHSHGGTPKWLVYKGRSD